MPRYCRGKVQRSSPYDSSKTMGVNQRYACEVTGKSATVGYRWGYLQYLFMFRIYNDSAQEFGDN